MMKPMMNSSTLYGFGAALLVALAAVYLSTDNPAMFINLPGLMIVLGGTVAATLVSYPICELRRLPRCIALVLNDRPPDAEIELRTIRDAAQALSNRRIKPVEDMIEASDNPYFRTGLQMVLDGAPLSEIREVLQWRMAKLRQNEDAEARIFRSMAVFAPAFGMVGTLLGLIGMLEILGSEALGRIGSHMALALITTLYGIVLANLVFKPMAIKLERRTEQRLMHMNLLLEGIVMLAERRSPSFVQATLNAINADFEDEIQDVPAAAETPVEMPLQRRIRGLGHD